MARPKKSASSSSKQQTPKEPSKTEQQRRHIPEDAVWGGFLNARMDDTNAERFAIWFPEQGGNVWSLLEDVLAEGLKFSLAYDADNEAWITTITGKLCLTVDLRCAASARAGTAQEALALLMFKHYVMAEEDWGSFISKSGSFMKWG